MNSLRSMVNQNMEEVENKIGNLTHDVRSVASGLEECNSGIQTDKRNYQLEIQRLESQIENLRANVNGNLAMHNESVVCASPQTSTTIRVTDVGRPTSQASLTVSELSNRNSPGVNGVSDSNTSRCNNVRNSSIVAVSGVEIVSAQSETYVDTSQYNELSLPRFTGSSQQVAVYFIRELDEYFSLRKTPEELRLPLVFRSISDPFVKQWMLTAYGQLRSYDDFKRAFTEFLWDSTRQSEIRCRVYQDLYDYRSGEIFSERLHPVSQHG